MFGIVGLGKDSEIAGDVDCCENKSTKSIVISMCIFDFTTRCRWLKLLRLLQGTMQMTHTDGSFLTIH